MHSSYSSTPASSLISSLLAFSLATDLLRFCFGAISYLAHLIGISATSSGLDMKKGAALHRGVQLLLQGHDGKGQGLYLPLQGDDSTVSFHLSSGTSNCPTSP